MSHLTRQALAVVGAGALALTAATAASASASTSHRHRVSNAPSWVGASRTSKAASTSRAVHAKVWLAPRDAAALSALARSVSDPDSSAYGAYLSAAQYRARFAPTAATVDAVRTWARGAGLHVDGVGADNHFVSVSGSQQAVSNAFQAGLREFTVNGVTGTAPTTAVTVPDTLATSVLAVTGLDTVAHRAQPANSRTRSKDVPSASADDELGPPAGYVNSNVCGDYYGQRVDRTDPAFRGHALPYSVCGYTPKQFRSAYGVTGTGLTGRRSTVAIVDAFAAPTILKDANNYAARQGDAPFARGQFTQHNDTNYDPQRVTDCGGNGWFGEETLDVEAAHGMAPNADIAYYGAASCYDDDLMASLSRIVSDNKASIVSNSWGEPTYVVIDGVTYSTIDDALVAAYDSVFTQGAVQGIGFYFSSGDDGDEVASTGVKSPDFPAADPWVTAVGGTSLAIDRSGRRQFETGWGTEKYSLTGRQWTSVGYLYGAGGGCSDVFAKPFYQARAATGCAMRGVADVAMDADPTTGMLVGETQVFDARTEWGQGTRYGEYRIGGTSLAAPLFAGLQAARQDRGHRIGFANPAIYALARVRGVFHDVTPQGDAGNVRVDYANGLNADDGLLTSVRTFDDDSSLPTNAGWDEPSGVGAPTQWYALSGYLG